MPKNRRFRRFLDGVFGMGGCSKNVDLLGNFAVL